MRLRREDPKNQEPKRDNPRPDRAELSIAMQDNGAPEGFNLEWICDRYKPCEGQR